MLTIIPTPIGNLKDITLRAIEVLQGCDALICEDTRVSAKLLNHYKNLLRSSSNEGITLARRTLPFSDEKGQINKPLISLNDYNEARMVPQILDRLKNGQNLALISDAGTPLISDPGYKLVRECLKEGIEVDSLPGPSAVTTALTLSGLPPDKFMFLGFPPDKPGHRQDLYAQIKQISEITPTTFILFVAPFKVLKTLTEMQTVLGDVEVCLARELTKIYQEVKTQKISGWLEKYQKQKPKGEYVLLLRI